MIANLMLRAIVSGTCPYGCQYHLFRVKKTNICVDDTVDMAGQVREHAQMYRC